MSTDWMCPEIPKDYFLRIIWDIYVELLQDLCYRKQYSKPWRFPKKKQLLLSLEKIKRVCEENNAPPRAYLLAQFYYFNENQNKKRPQLYWLHGPNAIMTYKRFKEEVLANTTVDRILETKRQKYKTTT